MIKFCMTALNFQGRLALGVIFLFTLWSCEEDDVNGVEPPVEDAITYQLASRNNSNMNGYVQFYEVDGGIEARIQLASTQDGMMYPAHIHANSAVETGDIEVTFEPVNGSTGSSKTLLTNLSLEDIENYDGYVNVHQSENDLSLIAQTDIGGNILTGNAINYDLSALTEANISGNLLFEERRNGFVKARIQLEGTEEGQIHPAHIHMNTAAEGGGIVISFNPVDGTSGLSETNIRATDDGEDFSFNQITDFDGYVNIHQSEEELGVILAQGDIGQNDLNGNAITYNLEERAVEGISGTITFEERNNLEVLASIVLEGTEVGNSHPAHIHQNTFLEGGGIALSFKEVSGATGISKTNITSFDNGDSISFDIITNYDGYVNVHLSAEALGTIIAQNDIGANELTGESTAYPLYERAIEGVSGTATLYQRKNGNSLMELALQSELNDTNHPAHIHAQTAAEGGGIALTLSTVDANTGMSMTTIRQFDDGTAVSYEQLLEYDGHINLHLSTSEMGTIIAQGDFGQNVLTGNTTEYALNEVESSGVSGRAVFSERANGYSLVELFLEGTQGPATHPAHIHFNSAEAGGGIAVDLNSVSGTTGISRTHITAQNNNNGLTYEDLTAFDGYINVHQSASNLATILSQGNIGSNAMMEE